MAEFTNKDLLSSINRSRSQNYGFEDDNFVYPESILPDTEKFLETVNRNWPNQFEAELTPEDISLPGQGPMTQQGYSGPDFSVPTIATGGMVYPYHILAKRRAAKIEGQRVAEQEQIKFDYDVAKLNDEINNILFTEKQDEYFKGMLFELKEHFGDEQQALRYMDQNNLIKQATRKWSNFADVYNKAYDNYIKVSTDTNSLGNSKYDEGTRRLAKEFETFIAGIDDFDPSKVDEYIKFHNKFNERMTLADIIKQGVEMMKEPYIKEYRKVASPEDYDAYVIEQKLRSDFDNNAETIWGLLGPRDSTEGDKKIFMDMLKGSFIEQTLDDLKFVNTDNMSTWWKKKEMEAGLAKVKELEKPENIITVSDQEVSVKDPLTQETMVLDAKNVITFPKKTIATSPGKDVYIEGVGIITINDVVPITPVREFTANVNLEALKGDQEILKEAEETKGLDVGKLKTSYFIGKGGDKKGSTEQNFIQAEINAFGSTKGEWGQTLPDVVNYTDKNGQPGTLVGKQTVIIPQKNVNDNLVNTYGENYTNAKAKIIKPVEEKKVEPKAEEKKEEVRKPILSVKKFQEAATKNKWHTVTYTKEYLQKKYGDKYEVVD